MTNELTYAAIITLYLPGMGKSASVTVTLAPSSAVETAGGRVKPLCDCTLADLQEFADILEEEIWAAYQAIRLIELADTGQSQLKVRILNEVGDSLPAIDEWLEHAVVLSELAATVEMEPEQDVAGIEVDDEQGAAAETTLVEEVEPVTAKVPASEPAVEVAEAEPEPEPVEKEREVEVTTPVPAGEPEPLPDIEIAGRRRPLGYPTWAAVDILINKAAFRDAQAHALSSLDREAAGVLVGPPPEKQPDGRYVVHVTDTIIAKYTRMHGASVTYTPESWRYLNDRLAELYPDESAVMVGWYHTHPGFGIFLSSMDLFIHENFFTQIWHVALVLDPVGRKSGFFCWDRTKTQVKPYEFPWPEWAFSSW